MKGKQNLFPPVLLGIKSLHTRHLVPEMERELSSSLKEEENFFKTPGVFWHLLHNINFTLCDISYESYITWIMYVRFSQLNAFKN